MAEVCGSFSPQNDLNLVKVTYSTCPPAHQQHVSPSFLRFGLLYTQVYSGSRFFLDCSLVHASWQIPPFPQGMVSPLITDVKPQSKVGFPIS